MLAFGPIPSRRLGKSLGINNIPVKICPYSCVYCQLGNTINMSVKQKSFYNKDELFRKVQNKVKKARLRRGKIDFLTFVPDGEPTLDLNLKEKIKSFQVFHIPVAILTNASLIWIKKVKVALLDADFISVKVDTVSEEMWKNINRPHKSLDLKQILDGLIDFSKDFKGTLVTETMLIDGFDYTDEMDKIANFLARIKPSKAYIAIPTRPPAEEWVKPPEENVLNEVFQCFADKLGIRNVEYLIGYEGNAFAFTGNVKEDILSITSVHPMREDAIEEFLKKADVDWSIIKELLSKGKLIMVEYENHKYYMRRIASRIVR
jgi:wyosine [tRNA(Phe)-imidazoG37] synthetase (radical SAM superfamily)